MKDRILGMSEAIRILTRERGRGFSRSTILRRIESGEWIQGKHWESDHRVASERRLIKINVDYVLRDLKARNTVKRRAG